MLLKELSIVFLFLSLLSVSYSKWNGIKKILQLSREINVNVMKLLEGQESGELSQLNFEEFDINEENNVATLQSWGPGYTIQFEVKLKSLSSDFQEIISIRPIEDKNTSITMVSARSVGEKFELKITNDDDETTFPFLFSGDSSDLLNEWKTIFIDQEDIHNHHDSDSHHQVQFTVRFGEETLSHTFGNLLMHVHVGIFIANSEDHAEGQIRNLKFTDKNLESDGFYPRILSVFTRFPEEYKFDIDLNEMDYPSTDSDWLEGLFQMDTDNSGLSPLPGIGLISKSGENSGKKYICVKINETDSCKDSNLVSSLPVEFSKNHTLTLKQVKEKGSDNYLFSASLDRTLIGTKIIPSTLVTSHSNVSAKIFKKFLKKDGSVRNQRCPPCVALGLGIGSLIMGGSAFGLNVIERV